MSIFTIHNLKNPYIIDKTFDHDIDDYTVDTNRKSLTHEEGDLNCYANLFHDVPITLNLAIRDNGDLAFMGWKWSAIDNHYLHTSEEPFENNRPWGFSPTEKQIDTVAGLFSGRIKFEGLKLNIGYTMLKVCPFDTKKEYDKIGKRIFLT